MDKTLFLKALLILHEENKKQPASDFNAGYSKALFDVLQVEKEMSALQSGF